MNCACKSAIINDSHSVHALTVLIDKVKAKLKAELYSATKPRMALQTITYEGYLTNKLQNSVIPLILKIGNIRNICLSTELNFEHT